MFCIKNVIIKAEKFAKFVFKKGSFLIKDFVYLDILNFLEKKPGFKELVQFHTSYKYFIYSKSHRAYKHLGAIVANSKKKPIEFILKDYKNVFLEAIFIEEGISNTYNVLLHIFGYFKKLMSKEEKEEVLKLMEEYKKEKIPLSFVIKRINFYTNKYDVTYLKKQKFLKGFK